MTHDEWRKTKIYFDNPVPIRRTMQAMGVVPTTFGQVIGLAAAQAAYPYRGAGVSVAVIDSGIDYTHAALGGGFGPGKRVVAGYDFWNETADPMDIYGHGTGVAGIIASSSLIYPGICPQVTLLALKITEGATGASTFDELNQALEWVVAHQAQYNIVAVNISMAGGNYLTNPFQQGTFMVPVFSALAAKNIFVAASAGNEFFHPNNSAPGVAFPAVAENVCSVGATWAGDYGGVDWSSGAQDSSSAQDRVVSFSDRASILDMMAPGAFLDTTKMGGGFEQKAGTSEACPVITGCAVLIGQALRAKGLSATPTAILNIMKATGKNVKDGDDEQDNVTNTGLTFKRVNLYAAMLSASPANRAPVLAVIPPMTLIKNTTGTTTLSATDLDNNTLLFSALVLDYQTPYLLNQKFGLYKLISYQQNSRGLNEKWIQSTGATAPGTWYAILPNGEFRRWPGRTGVNGLLAAVNLIDRLTPGIWQDPTLLHEAAVPTVPAATVSINPATKVLTVTPPTGFTGVFRVQVTCSDGQGGTAIQKFVVTVIEQPT